MWVLSAENVHAVAFLPLFLHVHKAEQTYFHDWASDCHLLLDLSKRGELCWPTAVSCSCRLHPAGFAETWCTMLQLANQQPAGEPATRAEATASVGSSAMDSQLVQARPVRCPPDASELVVSTGGQVLTIRRKGKAPDWPLMVCVVLQDLARPAESGYKDLSAWTACCVHG